MDNQDKLHHCKEMLRSEGWLLLRDLLIRFLTKKEKEKVLLLRQEAFNKALYIQGKIDGINELLIGNDSELDKYLAELAKETEVGEPAY